MCPLNLSFSVRMGRAAISSLLLGLPLGACDEDPQSNCTVASNAAARDAANGFEVRHETPERCPVEVPPSGGRAVNYSAEVNVIAGRQTNALTLSIYDADDLVILRGDFFWRADPDGGSKLLTEPNGSYTAGRVAPTFGSSKRDIANNAVPVVGGQVAVGTVFLTYDAPALAIATSDAYIDQPFSATATPIGPEPAWPVTYEWQLDGASVGSSQTFETSFHDNFSHLLEVIVTDALGRVERKTKSIVAVYYNGGSTCDHPPCGGGGP